MGKFWKRLEVGWGKVACSNLKAAISPKCVKIEEKLLQKAYRNSLALLNGTIPAPYSLPFGPSPRFGVHNPHPKLPNLQSKISGKWVLIEE